MVLFTLAFATWTAIRLTGNISAWVYGPRVLKGVDAEVARLQAEGKGLQARLWSDVVTMLRWQQEQAYGAPVEAAADIAASVVGVRGLQLGLPLATRIGRTFATRVAIRRWEDMVQVVTWLFTGQWQEAAEETVKGSVDLTLKGAGLVREGQLIFDDVWNVAHGQPIGLLGLKTLGIRVLNLIDGILDFIDGVKEILPETPDPEAPRIVGDPSRRALQNFMQQDFEAATTPPPPPPPGVATDPTDIFPGRVIRGWLPPPIVSLTDDEPSRILDGVLRRSRVSAGDLRRIVQALKSQRGT